MVNCVRTALFIVLLSCGDKTKASPPKVDSDHVSASLQGRRIEITRLRASFELPVTWIDWHKKFRNGIHSSRKELEAVKVGEGEWDSEYSRIVNAVFPFASCVLHAGNDGWGRAGGSFADVQMRVYVVESTPAQVAERVMSKGRDEALQISKMATARATLFGGWHRVTIECPLWYEDYGDTAGIDVFARTCGGHTLVLVFMYLPDNVPNWKDVSGIVESVACCAEKNK